MIEDCLNCEPDPIEKQTSKYLHPCMNPNDKEGQKCAWLHRDAIRMLELFELNQNDPSKLDALDYQDYKLVKSIILTPNSKENVPDMKDCKKEIDKIKGSL